MEKIKENEAVDIDNVENVEQQFKQMEQTNEVVKILNLSKTYETGKKAVQNLNLTIY